MFSRSDCTRQAYRPASTILAREHARGKSDQGHRATDQSGDAIREDFGSYSPNAAGPDSARAADERGASVRDGEASDGRSAQERQAPSRRTTEEREACSGHRSGWIEPHPADILLKANRTRTDIASHAS